MKDQDIVELYWQRKESAIEETARKYGSYCHRIAHNILHDNCDAEECVSDTYIRAWNSMPDNRPSHLAPYLGKMTRWLALDRLERNTCQKRGGTDVPVPLEDAENLARTCDSVYSQLEYRELCKAIECFLARQAPADRQVFLARYWFMASIQEISLQFDFHESKVKSMLMRTRNKLMSYLKEEGLC